MKRWVWPGLLCAVFLSMAMRIWPLTQGVFWGVDSAEYYGILQGLQDTGALPTAGYAGFGVTYPYFPGFFHVTFLPAVAGMDLLTSLRWTIPLLGSLSVLLAFLLALEITGDERVAVLASLFLAAFSPHVLQGARPMPGTLGEILMLASIFFFVRASKEDRDRGECWALFLISGFALVVTHHLSALFLVVILSGGMLMDNLFRETESPRAAIRAGMLLAITAFMGMFWLSISSFRSAILGNLPGPPMLLAFLPCAGPIIAMAPLALGEHRLGPGKMRRGWMRLSLPVGVVTAVVGGLGLGTLGYFAGAPDFLALFLFMLPTVLVICLLSPGISPLLKDNGGRLLLGGLAAMCLSYIAITYLDMESFPPYRHFQYLSFILVIVAATGVIWASLFFPGRRSVPGALAVILVIALAFTAIPPQDILPGQDTPSYDMAAAAWIGENVPEEGLVASDHRLSSLAYGVAGKDATWGGAGGMLEPFFFEGDTSVFKDFVAPSGKTHPQYVYVDQKMGEASLFSAQHTMIGIDLDIFSSYPRLYDDGANSVYLIPA